MYDYFLTLADEIQYVWPTHWCLGKVLYLSSKYLIIVLVLAELHCTSFRILDSVLISPLNMFTRDYQPQHIRSRVSDIEYSPSLSVCLSFYQSAPLIHILDGYLLAVIAAESESI